MTGTTRAADVRIRPFDVADTDALYEVCLRTGDAGADASGLTDDPTLLGEIYVGPYLVHAPHLALVAELDGRPAGYALAVADTDAFERWCDRHWWDDVRDRHPVPAAPRPYDRDLHEALADPTRVRHPDLPGYPAHLHIDLLAPARGGGVGRRMMDELFALLRAHGAPGVHLGVDVRNEGGLRFYDRLGFRPLAPDRDGVRYLGLPLDGATL